jgi:hypothetical protein
MFIHGANTRADYQNTADGVQTAIVAADDDNDRNVVIVVSVTETFANGSGAQPTFKIGETGDDNKFAETTEFTGLTEGDKRAYAGVLSATAELLVTANDASGTGTGAINVRVVTFPQSL